ncbi:hypothetical protein [Kribbella koreensis]|uniref:hypothetical protein n=1 Tax=Kribbella koreensis TaxID=57909 RepID=UPI0031D02323
MGKTGGGVVLADQEFDLGAAQDHAFCAGVREPLDDVEVGGPRRVADDPAAQFVVDH